MSDLIERLRGRAWFSIPDLDIAREAAAALEAAEAKLDAIDALHQRAPSPWYTSRCGQCEAKWPCPTHRILHPEEDQ